jgi:hypothetical protein
MFLENDKIGDIVYLYEDGTVIYNDKVCISSPFKIQEKSCISMLYRI